MTGQVGIKRIYEPPAAEDGYRVLVDRLWPRGVSHERADLDEWCKEIAPSPELRTWWEHDPARMAEFAERYRAELDENPAVGPLEALRQDHARITLLYAAHDPAVNHALILRDYLLDRGGQSGGDGAGESAGTGGGAGADGAGGGAGAGGAAGAAGRADEPSPS